MKIHDFDGPNDVSGIHAIGLALSRRHFADGYGFNSFWLSHEKPFPALLILSRDDSSVLYYLPRDRDAGSRSVGTTERLAGVTEFRMDSADQPLEVPDEAIVPSALAVRAAVEFEAAAARPLCVSWLDL